MTVGFLGKTQVRYTNLVMRASFRTFRHLYVVYLL